MSDSENRHIARDSLFVLADLRLEGSGTEHRVKIRNLSTGGLMAEAPLKVTRGDPVKVNLRNIGWVDGAVAWVQAERFGIAFSEEIDPKLARTSMIPGEGTPRFTKAPLPVSRHDRGDVLRKI